MIGSEVGPEMENQGAREAAEGLMAQEIEAAIRQAATARCRELGARCREAEAQCKVTEAAVEASPHDC